MKDPATPEQEAAELAAINAQPFGKRLGYYTRKSGPGWLQGAITLGGGSLAGGLYLGVIMGYGMMWLQPLAMILGVIMLSAIAYVTLTTQIRPFRGINEHISPVLGWSWLIAAMMANIVWCMPQFNLGRAAIQQNLLPVVGDGTGSTVVICVILFAIAATLNFFYDRSGKGIKVFEMVLKAMVGIVVLSFFFVVISLTVRGQLQWGAIFAGLIPDFTKLTQPAPAFRELIEQSAMGDYWANFIASEQKDRIITAFATAVGINMTFLLPYSMLRKRWTPQHRSLAIYDLSIGLIVPFVLATSCIVIASASQFHGQFADVFDDSGEVRSEMASAYHRVLDGRLSSEFGEEFSGASDEEKGAMRAAAPETDRQLAAMLANRDNFNLANALSPLTGDFFAQVIFGIGVLGMALSTIVILMLINGFVFCEIFNRPGDGRVHFLGAIVAGLGGIAGPFIWGNADARTALAVPTSVIGGAMIPIAYFTFFLLMNSKSILGAAKPTGANAVKWNVLMGIATIVASVSTVWSLSGRKLGEFPIGNLAIGFLALLFVLGLVGFIKNERKSAAKERSGES